MNFLTDVLYEFQSTLLQEERQGAIGYMYWISTISIHAPTRGATHGPCECLQLYPYFNPRSYKRSDYYDVVVDRDVDLFQSTLLQEERRRIVCPADHYSYFNPRSYKRSDRVLFFVLKFPKISIHAPTRGATLPIIRDILFSAYFNPRSYKRSDSPSLFALSTIFHFNPRSYKRSDLYIIINIICCVISIHAPTRGATKTNTHHHQTQHYFNPRSYKRSDIVFFASVLESSVFQSTLLQEERPGLLCTDHRSLEFQSTLLQEERPL